MESILTSIKKLVGITEEDDAFDTDIILYTNSAFSTLNQIGAGPEDGFFIFDDTITWTDYTESKRLLGFVKQYVYIKVKLIFDPPTLSKLLEAYERTAKELEERIKIFVESPDCDDISVYTVDDYINEVASESILTSVKKLLGITEEDETFDMGIIIFINAAFSILNQIGAGPLTGFFISDEHTTWSEYTTNATVIGFVKQYVYIKVKLIFDPPTASSVLEAYTKVANEFEERIMIASEQEEIIIPSGTIHITENGTYNVIHFADAKIEVPIPEGFLKPEGTLDININNTYNVETYKKVNVNVPIPEGFLKPEGTLDIDSNGQYNIYDKENVNVNVPTPEGFLKPEGKININNTEEIDVSEYKKAQVVDENLKAENIAENVEVLGIKGTFKGGIDTSDGTITPDKVLKDEVGYSKENRVIGTIETYDGANSKNYPSNGILVITKKGAYDVKHYDFVIVDPQEEQTDVLTEEQIQALESILISHEDINNVSITYNDEILDLEIIYENEELIINNNMKQVSFRINKNKELEVTY